MTANGNTYHWEDKTIVVIGVLADEVHATRRRGSGRRLAAKLLLEQLGGTLQAHLLGMA